MPDIDPLDRRAMGILSDAVAAQLGPSAKVTREVRRAYVSGKEIDRFTARAAFDALPGWQRGLIDRAATEKAYATIGMQLRGTARDWRDLPTTLAPRSGQPRSGRPIRPTAGAPESPHFADPTPTQEQAGIAGPPRFLRRHNDN